MFTNFEKVRQRSLSLRLLFGQVHSDGEVVDKSAVYIEDNSFAKTGDKHVAQFLILIPRSYALGKSNSE